MLHLVFKLKFVIQLVNNIVLYVIFRVPFRAVRLVGHLLEIRVSQNLVKPKGKTSQCNKTYYIQIFSLLTFQLVLRKNNLMVIT